jgi:hypothetical protein
MISDDLIQRLPHDGNRGCIVFLFRSVIVAVPICWARRRTLWWRHHDLRNTRKTAPARGVPRPSVLELRLGLGGKVGQSRVLALGYELAAIFLDLRRMRIRQLRLRVADSLSQHLAQLGLSLRRFTSVVFCPCGHEWHMGMLEGELNPR